MNQDPIESGTARQLVRRVLNLVPRSRFLLRVCRKYVDLYGGDNNADFLTNGELRFLSRYLPDSGVVFDIGANVGDWASLALKIRPAIELHCFEPSTKTYAHLQERRLPGSVVLNQLGLGESPGSLVLNVGNDLGLSSVYSRRNVFDVEGMRTESINVDTVDNYCARAGISHIGFLKVDVEGHELPVFRGMRGLLQANAVDIIQFEYGGCNLDSRNYLMDIWDYFQSIGHYRFYKLFPHGPRLIEKYHRSFETFQYSNWAIMSNARIQRTLPLA